MADELNPINTVVEKIDPNPPIATLSKTVVGALLVLSVFINLLQGGCRGYKEAASYTKEQYQTIEKERNEWKAKSENCDAKYNDTRANFWFAVDSLANVRAKEKIDQYFQINAGKNSIIIKPQ